MSSYSFSESITFTHSHAKQLGAKVATDLKRIQRFYGYPSDTLIQNFEAELIEFLKAGYLVNVTYGFIKDGVWIAPCLKYTAIELNQENATDDDPGRVVPGFDISGAFFTSFMTTNSAYAKATTEAREAFDQKLPFIRSTGTEPGSWGYFSNDLSYSSGGRGLNRSSLKNY